MGLLVAFDCWCLLRFGACGFAFPDWCVRFTRCVSGVLGMGFTPTLSRFSSVVVCCFVSLCVLIVLCCLGILGAFVCMFCYCL